jgi:MFS family permease
VLPVTLMMFVLSRRFGALADRFGPRFFMGAGPLVAAAGLLLFQLIGLRVDYVSEVLPGLLVFSLGLSMTVAPLTSAVLQGAEKEAGIASGVNNAVARLAGLLAVAVLPGLAGITAAQEGIGFGPGFAAALRIAAGLCVAGAVIAFITIRTVVPVRSVSQPLAVSCLDPSVADEPVPAA